MGVSAQPDLTKTARFGFDRRYERHLRAAYAWLLRSIEHGKGGSCAYYLPPLGWSPPYPETTGYLIPTLIASGAAADDDFALERAKSLGAWLLTLQQPAGFWHAGTHPAKRPEPSVFNTAQIIDGLSSLERATGESRWIDAAHRAGTWLAAGVDASGAFAAGNYRDGFNPTYYSQVAWPMLEVWKRTGDDSLRLSADRILRAVAAKCEPNGAFRDWGFDRSVPAFTHTIAYLLRGLLESSRLIGEAEYGELALPALETLRRRAEVANGRLAGAFDTDWRSRGHFVCLTGNAQVALCFLYVDSQRPDLRWVNAAAKLVDTVCDAQQMHHPVAAVRGAVAGSSPLLGRYMRLRFPNWAAKYHVDALTAIRRRLNAEAAAT